MSRKNLQTRTRILATSLALLEKSHGKGVRMTDIAKGAGISRQALYLHFSTRAELLIATTRYLDEVKGTDTLLQASRTAETGAERLDAYIQAWGSYIPEVYGIAKALLTMRDTDEAAAEAWDNRMQAMKEGCAAAILALNRDAMLSADYRPEDATDILWTLLSVRNWEQLTLDCGWSQEKYRSHMIALARQLFVDNARSQ